MADAVGDHSMFQYFLKVVSTEFSFLDGSELKTHQYSVTQYERDRASSLFRFRGHLLIFGVAVSGKSAGKDEQGHQTSHGYAGVPGAFPLSPPCEHRLTSLVRRRVRELRGPSFLLAPFSDNRTYTSSLDLTPQGHPPRGTPIFCSLPHLDLRHRRWSAHRRWAD